MTVRLTPAQAIDPETIERTAAAEWAYDLIMRGNGPLLHLWANVADDKDKWRLKAQRMLADLVRG